MWYPSPTGYPPIVNNSLSYFLGDLIWYHFPLGQLPLWNIHMKVMNHSYISYYCIKFKQESLLKQHIMDTPHNHLSHPPTSSLHGIILHLFNRFFNGGPHPNTWLDLLCLLHIIDFLITDNQMVDLGEIGETLAI